MSSTDSVRPGATPAASGVRDATPRDRRVELKRLAQQLEGVFVSYLFRALREPVTNGGVLGPSPGEELFTSLMDERMADLAAQRMKRGMGEAIYRQLSKKLPPG